MSTPHDVRHVASENRLEITVDGQLSVLDYQLRDAVMTITHTGVPPSLRGRGLAASLVAAAFRLAGENGWKVVPACSYAAAWAERHPDTKPLLA